MDLFAPAPAPYQDYIVASLGYNTKEEAYAEIARYRQGVTCTVYYWKQDGLWYIIEKKTW